MSFPRLEWTTSLLSHFHVPGAVNLSLGFQLGVSWSLSAVDHTPRIYGKAVRMLSRTLER